MLTRQHTKRCSVNFTLHKLTFTYNPVHKGWKTSFCLHILPLSPLCNVNKILSSNGISLHFIIFNVESGNGGTDTYSLGITVIISRFCVFSNTVGHFRVFLYLCFKTSLSAKPFIWKWVLRAVSFSCKSKSFSFHLRLASHLDSLWNRGTKELENGLFVHGCSS